MSRHSFFTMLTLFAFGAALHASIPVVVADTYKLDVSHTAIIFKIKHLQYSYTFGRFNHMEGQFKTGDQPAFEVMIRSDSVDTGFEKRDEHLRGPDYFNVKQFPVITFKSSAVEQHENDLHVAGDLMLHGVTKPVLLKLQKHGEGQDPFGGYRIGYSTHLTIKRSDFGMNQALDMVGDEVELMISFEGIRE